MFSYTHNGITLTSDAELCADEASAYIDRGIQQYGELLGSIDAHVDGDDIELTYNQLDIPFDRIRRITGYLVGTLDRFNDAKRAEESQRVKHTV